MKLLIVCVLFSVSAMAENTCQVQITTSRVTETIVIGSHSDNLHILYNNDPPSMMMPLRPYDTFTMGFDGPLNREELNCGRDFKNPEYQSCMINRYVQTVHDQRLLIKSLEDKIDSLTKGPIIK